MENATLAKDSSPPWVNFLDNGRIAQVGTHEKLMEEDGHYREAALSQCAA